MSYRIKSVAALTGIPATTLRAWERRYELVAPRRTAGGYRVYTEDDIGALSRVKALVDRGYRVGEAIDMVRRGAGELPPARVAPEELEGLRVELRDALLAMDRARALEVYSRTAALPPDRQVEEVLLPLLRDVGDGWHAGRISVAQEHFCSVFARGRMVGMLESLAPGARGGREAVCAGAPGELHEFGLMAAAIYLAMHGWRITYLGADVPLADLAPVLEQRRPQLVCTSIVHPLPEEECLRLARDLRAASPPETVIVLGGAGVPERAADELPPGTYFLRRLDELGRLGSGRAR